MLLPTQKKASAEGDESSETEWDSTVTTADHSRPRTWPCAIIVEAPYEDCALVHRIGRPLDLVSVFL